MPAWWSADLGDFLTREPETIVGALSTRLVETHPLNRATQVLAECGAQQLEVAPAAPSEITDPATMLL